MCESSRSTNNRYLRSSGGVWDRKCAVRCLKWIDALNTIINTIVCGISYPPTQTLWAHQARVKGRCVIAVLVVYLAAFLGVPDTAVAQERVLVSNIGKPIAQPLLGGTDPVGHELASTYSLLDAGNRFATGANTAGYRLKRVDIEFGQIAQGLTYTARIRSVASSQCRGKVEITPVACPDTSSAGIVGTLITPSFTNSSKVQTLTFTTPPGGIYLAPSTEYFLVIEVSGSPSASKLTTWSITLEDGEDTGGLTGWTIDNEHVWRGLLEGTIQPWGKNVRSSALKFKLIGQVLGTPGVTIDPTELKLTEGGSSTYAIVLDSEPAGRRGYLDIFRTVFISTADDTNAINIKKKFKFSIYNWVDPQKVKVKGTDNTNDQPNQKVTIKHTVKSNVITGYRGLTAPDVTITVIDDDPTVVSLEQHETGSLIEGSSGKAKFTVTLGRTLVDGERVDVPLVFSGAGITASDITLAKNGDNGLNTGVALTGADTLTPTITFTGSGAQTASLTLIAPDDNTDEGNGETLTVKLGTNEDFTDNKLGTNVGGGAKRSTTTNSFSVTINETDTIPPTVVSITRQTTHVDGETNADGLTWRVAFDEAVMNVDADDFTLTGPNASTTRTVSNVPGKEATTWDVTASGGNLATFDGTVTLSFAADQNIQDNDNNPLSSTTPRGTNENSYVVDNIAPTVASITRQTTHVDGETNADELIWRVTFNETVNVAKADFMVTGTDAVLSVMPIGKAGTTVDVTVSGGDLDGFDGPVTLAFANGQNITDVAGNVLDTTTTPSPNDVTYDLDNTAPTVVVSGLSGTLSGPATVTFTFSEKVNGFVQADIMVSNGVVSDFIESTTGMVWTALITPTVDGTVTVDVGAGVAMDAVGNLNPATPQASATYTAVPGITLIPRSLSVAEAGGEDTYTVVLNTQPTHAVEVAVNSGDVSTATIKKVGVNAGASQTLNFTTSNWNKAQTVTVTGVDDAVDNQGDKRTVLISHEARSVDTRYAIADAGSVTVTVTDDEDLPTALTLTLDGDTGTTGSLLKLAENVGPKTVRVTATLDGPATFAESKTVTIAIGAVDDSATESTDYQEVTDQSITIPAGQSSATVSFQLTPIDDSLYEGPETINIVGTLTNITTVKIMHAAIRLTDDEVKPTATLALMPSSIDEGQTTTVTATLSNAVDAELTLTVTAAAGARTVAEDFTQTGTTLTIAAGEIASTGVVTIAATDNTVDTLSKAVTVSADVSGGRGVDAPQDVTLTITDDEPTTVTLTTPDSTATEGNTTQTATLTLTIGRGLVNGETLEIPIAFDGGTPGTDFTLTCPNPLPTNVTCDDLNTATPKVTFTGPNAGTTATNVTLTLTASEDDNATGEVITVSIPASSTTGNPKLTATNLAGGATGTRTGNGQITITDNDTRGATLSTTDLTLTENTSGTYTIQLATQPDGDVTITATAPTGLTVDKQNEGSPGATQTLTFTATDWNTAQTITVTADNDNDDNPGSRTLAITHAATSTADTAYNNITIANVTVAITDDEPTTVTLTTPDSTATEGNTTQTATLTLTIGRGLVNGETLEIPIAFDGGTPGTDFTLTCPNPLPTNVTCDDLNTATPKVTFTGPNAGTTATNVTLTLTASEDDNATGEVITVSIPASSTTGNPKLTATNLAGGATGTRTGNGQITITDNDTRGATLSTTDLTLTENTSGTYTIQLATQPDGDVTITATAPTGLTVDKQNEGSPGATQTLTFTATDWNTAQTITVTADNDNDDNPGSRTLAITHAATSTADTAYNNITIANVTVAITDDEPTTVTLTTPDSTATEGNTTQTATLTLTIGRGLVNGETLEIPIAFDGGTPGTDFTLTCPNPLPTNVTCDDLNTATPKVTFTGPNAGTTATNVTLTLTASEDDNATGEVITVSIPASSTTGNPKLTATNLAGGATGTRTGNGQITITDNDTRGATLSTTDLTLTENTSGTYTIQLATQPDGDVTITATAPTGLTVDKQNEGSPGATQTLTFTATDWNTAQTITVTADNDNDDNPGSRTLAITHAATSTADTAYNNITIANVTVAITDDEPTTVTLTTPDSTATEGNTTQTATLTLTIGRGLVNGETLEIPIAFDGGTPGTDFTLTCPNPLPTNVTCDDLNTATPKVTFTGPNAGTTATNVTLTLTASEDDNATGEVITVSIPASSTTGNPKLTATNLAGGATGTRTGNGQITITDNDTRGATLSTTDLTLTENTSGTYTIQLATQPDGDVTITATAPTGLTVDKQNEGSPGATQTLTFTATDWNTAQTITVTADNDNDDNPGSRTLAITHAATSTADTAYNNITIANVTVAITDDEPTTVTLTTPDSTATEGNTTQTATLTLTIGRGLVNGETLEIPIAFDGGTPGTDFTLTCPNPLPTNVTCDDLNTATPKVTFTGPNAGTTATNVTLTLTASEDDNATGEVITVSIPASSTTGNPKLTATNLAGGATGTRTGNGQITITDNDTRGATLSTTDLTLTENTSGTYTIQLATQPDGDVTITATAPTGLTVDKQNEGSPGATQTLTFTATDWNTAQTITVTADNDNDDNPGSRTLAITHAATSTADTAYNNITIANVTVAITDDEPTTVTLTTPDSTATEGNTTQTATLTLTIGRGLVNGETLEIPIAFDGGTPGTDFTLTCPNPLPTNVTCDDLNTATPKVTFTGPNAGTTATNVTLTLTASEDDNATGEVITVSIPASSTTGNPKLTATNLAGGATGTRTGNGQITITDNDTRGATLSTTDLTLTENTSGTYTIQLATQPDGDVTITATAPTGLTVDKQNEGSPGATQTLTFTATDWNTAQTITVTADNDNDDNPGSRTLAITHAATSTADTAYNNITIANVTVAITDDEPTTVTLTTPDSTATEGNTTQTATLTLTIGRGLVNGETLEIPIAFDGGTPGTDFTLTCPNPLPTNVTCDDLNTATPKVTFTGPNAGTTATNVTLTLTASEDDNATGEVITVSIPASSTTGNPKLTATNLAGGATGTRTGNGQITITDNDTRGATLSTTDLTLTENTSGTYTIQLATQPDGDVTITATAPTGLTVDKQNEGSPGATQTLTFTATDWNTAQTITVTADNDNDDNPGSRTLAITHAATSTADTAYNNITIANVTVAITDDEPTTVTLTTPDSTATEGNTTQTATLTLTIGRGLVNGETLEIPIAFDGGTPGTDFTLTCPNPLPTNVTCDDLNTATPKVTFTGPNAGTTATNVTLTLTASEDDNATGEVITVSIPASSTTGNPKLTATNLAGGATGTRTGNGQITITDNDTRGATLSTTDLTLTENTSGTYTIQLATQPDGDVTITATAPTGLTVDKQNEGSPGATQTLTFTATDWNTAQTITVTADNDNDDNPGSRTLAITHAATSTADTAYNNITIANVTVAITDDEPTTVTLTTPDSTATEGNTTQTATLTLTIGRGLVNGETLEIPIAFDGGTPGTDFTLTCPNPLPTNVTCDDLNTATPKVTFTGPNAGTTATNVTLTLTASEDDNATGEVITVSIPASSTTGNPKLTATNLAGGATGTRTGNGQITITDNDTRGATVIPTSITLQETDNPSTTATEENKGTYTITLDSEPTGDVVIDLTVPNGAPFTVTPSSLTFTLDGATIWSTGQTVTVTAINDDIDNTGNQRQAVITHAATSDDTAYNGIEIDDVTITITDDDLPMVSFTLTTSQTEEDAGMHYVMVMVEPISDTGFMVEFDPEGGSGTAKPEIDYNVKPEIMIPAGESSAQIPVKIMVDDIQEGDETIKMKLIESPQASPEYQIGDINTHTITIVENQPVNPDPMSAWATRFGREVAEHVVEGIFTRIEAPRYGQTEIQLAGYQLDLNPTGSLSDPDLIPVLRNNQDDRVPETENPLVEQNNMTLHDALLNSSFTAMGRDGSRLEDYVFWGQGAQSFFEGREGELSFGGEVTTAMLGADRTRGKWLVGLAVLQGTGEGTYSLKDEPVKNIKTSLTAIVPYASVATSEQFKLWGALGYGNGWIEYDSDLDHAHRADLSWSLAAIGFRSDLLAATQVGDPEIALVADAFWTATKSKGTDDLEDLPEESTRVRFGLEANWEVTLGEDRYLTPNLGIALRHDGGDAETGLGVEVSAGVTWHDASRGLAVDLSGTKLISHADENVSDQGYSLSVLYDPNPDSKRGLSAIYSQSTKGTEHDILNALPKTGSFDSDNTISRQAAISYGFPAFGGYTSSPYLEVSESGSTRDLTLGGRLTRDHGYPDLELGIMGRRSEGNGSAPYYSVGVNMTTRW